MELLCLFWIALNFMGIIGSGSHSNFRAKVLVLYSSGDFYNETTENVLTSPDGMELIFSDLNTSGCHEQEARAVFAFIDEVFVKNASVVATVGPSCTDSAYAISRLTSRREVSMIHFHTSPMPMSLAANLSYSFGLLGPVDLLADASVALIQHSNWSQVMVLYQDTNTETNSMYNRIQKLFDGNGTIRFSTVVHSGHIPLGFILSNHALRVIFLILDADLARKVLCMGYHHNAVYPTYQWVILRTTLSNLVTNSPSFVYAEGFTCSEKNILHVLQNALLVNFDSKVSGRDVTSQCINQHNDLELSLYQCSIYSLDILLNSNVKNVMFHRPNWLVTIHRIMSNMSESVATYSTSTSSINQASDQLLTIVLDPYVEVVNTPLAITFFALTAFILTLLFIFQVATFFFRNEKSVRANSPVLLCVSYLGVYIIGIVAFIYFTQKTIVISSDNMYIHLCQTFLLAGSIGFTLMTGMMVVRSWRLYQIFVHFKDPGKLLSDAKLITTIVCMTTVDFIICLIWFVLDPIKREYAEVDLSPINGRTTSRAICVSKAYPILLMLLFCYQLVPMVATVWFAYLLRQKVPRTQRNFRSLSVVKLVYVVMFIFGLGLPLYYVSHYFLRNLEFEFIVVGILLDGNITACIVLLFVPPLLPVAKRYLTSSALQHSSAEKTTTLQ